MRRYLRRIGLVSFFLVISTVGVFADDTRWYQNNEAILSNNGIIEGGVRWLGWAVIKLLCLLADATQTLYDKTFGLIDLTNYPGVNNIITQLKPVLVALTVLCIVGFAIISLWQHEKKPIVRNVLLAMLTVSCSAYIFTTANTLVNYFREGMLTEQQTNESYVAINNNMIDLVGIDKKGAIMNLNYGKGEGIQHTIGIDSRASLDGIDINETLNWSDSKKGKDLYGWSDTLNSLIQYKAVRLPNGKYTKEEVYNGILTSPVGNEFYYRYSFDFWSAALELFSLVVIFISLSYKNVRIAYELMVSRVLAYMYAADVGNGERLKGILLFIRDTYITLCVSILCVRLYQIMAGAITSFGITGLTKGIVLVFIAYAVIDGPNIVERITGIDAGLSSSLARAMAVVGLAKGGAKLAAAGIGKGASSIGKAGAAAATGKTSFERQQENDHASLGEKIGKRINSKFDEKPGDESKFNSEVKNPNEFMDDGSGYGSTSFMDSSSDNSSTNKDKTGRFHNEEFSNAVKALAPDKDASVGERKDFNRQVNNIVRGSHTAIEPPKGTRAEYKFRNYEKAKELESAYRKGAKKNEKK